MRPRSLTVATKHGADVACRVLRVDMAQPYDDVDFSERPRTRADCQDAPRPCPWVGCSHHLYLDVHERTGSLKLNFPELEPWELPHSCSLDLADTEGAGMTLEATGDRMNLTRERVAQIEESALDKLVEFFATPQGAAP